MCNVTQFTAKYFGLLHKRIYDTKKYQSIHDTKKYQSISPFNYVHMKYLHTLIHYYRFIR